MEILFTSVITFASTNIDDIFILALFFGDKRYKSRDIYVGQYLGIIALIAASVIGSLIGNFIDGRYIGLLGLIPIYLGIRQFIQLIKDRTESNEPEKDDKITSKSGILGVATITIANGGDNIATYIPLFATLEISDRAVMVAIFLLMVLIWLTTAKYLTKHPMLAKLLSKYGHLLTPVVLIGLGLFILHENGSFDLVR